MSVRSTFAARWRLSEEPSSSTCPSGPPGRAQSPSKGRAAAPEQRVQASLAHLEDGGEDLVAEATRAFAGRFGRSVDWSLTLHGNLIERFSPNSRKPPGTGDDR